MAKILEGNLTISRVNSSHTDDYVNIRLIDSISGDECVDIVIHMEEFALAVTGLARQRCRFEFRPTNVGKQRETKTVLVPHIGDSAEQTAAALAPFEIDGWRGSGNDYHNRNRHNVTEGVRYAAVGFIRFVDAAEGNPAGE